MLNEPLNTSKRVGLVGARHNISSLSNTGAGSPNTTTNTRRNPKPLHTSITITSDEIRKYLDNTLSPANLDTDDNITQYIRNTNNFSDRLLSQSKIKEKTNQLYRHFLEILQCRTTDSEIFDTIQDLIQACTDTLDEITKCDYIESGSTTMQQTIFLETINSTSWLVHERNTWRLLYCLYKDRLIVNKERPQRQHQQQQQDEDELLDFVGSGGGDGGGIMDDDDDLPSVFGSSEKTIIERLFQTNGTIREYQLIVDWLEQSAIMAPDGVTIGNVKSNVEHFTDRTVTWENTLHQLQNKINGTTLFGSSDLDIVKSLDPDAPYREKLSLHDLDREDELRLSKQILAELRQGKIDEAQKHAEYCGQSWRAAILEGWRLHHDPNYEMSGMNPDSKLPIEGNPHRDIWKYFAWKMADEKLTLDGYTRAYIGVLCGHLDSVISALNNSWSDLLWGYLKIQIDLRVETELRSCSQKSYIDMPEKYWKNKMSLEEIFDELNAHQNVTVSGVANKPINIIQKYLILDDIPEMMNHIDNWINESKIDFQMLRLLTHIVLFMRQIGRQHSDEIGDKIIKAYVECLIRELKDSAVIAFYTSSLPESLRLYLYSKYLETINETNERKIALEEALNAGLDIESITCYTVETIRTKNEFTPGTNITNINDYDTDGLIQDFDDLDEEYEDTEDIDLFLDNEQQQQQQQQMKLKSKQLHGTITALDLRKISCLEWLTFYDFQNGELLWQANAMIRTFLAQNKIECVRKVIGNVPKKTISQIFDNYGGRDNLPCMDECSIKEFLCHETYLRAIDGFNDWTRLYHNKPKEPILADADANFTERIASEHKQQSYENELERWQINLKEQTKLTRDLLYNVILFPAFGYLIDPDNVRPVPDRLKSIWANRQIQMENLRKICIPEIVLLLHKVLHLSGEYKQCLQLGDHLASENLQLYTVFSKQKLSEIILKISESSLALMNEKFDPWGYPMTT